MASRTRPRRTRRPLRRHLAVGALLAAAPGLTACGYGFGVQTDQPYQPGVGNNAREGSMNVLGATIVVQGEDAAQEGTFSAGLVNGDLQQGNSLAGITSESGELEVTLLAPVEIGPEAITNLSDSGAVLVEGDLVPGGYVRLNLAFDNGDQVSINVPVVNDLGDFADVVPAQAPTEPPATSPSAEPETPQETPTEGPSSEPTEG